MLLKPGEEFSADRIIELALRQDVQPDGSIMMNRQNYKLRDWSKNEEPNWEYKKKYRDTTPIIGPDAYFAGNNVNQRRKQQFEFEQEKPATFINRPLSRGHLRKKLRRRLDKQDVDYKNLPMMVTFLNDMGKLKNRF